jgi:hypothetical protein
MATATEVHLPKDHKARFPDRCVVCGAASPGSTLRLKTSRSCGFGWLAWIFSESYVVDAPACADCARWLRVQRFFDVLLFFVVGGGAAWLAFPYVEQFHLRRLGMKLAVGSAILVAVLPMLTWRAFHPYPIGLSLNAKSLVYEFGDEGAACEFAELNRDADWVEIK